MVEIARHTSGSGPPLVLVHGTSGDHSSFRLVRPLLAERFTVIAIDRRGRGGSGDEKEYSIEREFEDVAAVVDSIGGPVDLLGHSFGATVALGAAPLAQSVRRLVLYEPAPGIEALSAAELAWLEQASPAEILEYVMKEFAGFDDGRLAWFRASPMWARRVSFVHTVPRELRAEQECELGVASIGVPALLLLGSESPEWAQRGTSVVSAALADCQVAVLPGQGHAATLTAPHLVAREVIAFLSG